MGVILVACLSRTVFIKCCLGRFPNKEQKLDRPSGDSCNQNNIHRTHVGYQCVQSQKHWCGHIFILSLNIIILK